MSKKDCYLAIDIGGSKLAAGLVGGDGTVLQSHTARWTSLDKNSVLETIIAAAKRYSGEARAVGVNIPGLTDHLRGVWVEACFSGIRDVPIVSILEEELELPAFIDNDVNNCALAESMFGVCRGVDDFAWQTVSNGCGGALFLGGAVYGGIRNTAGEFGHIIVEEDPGKALRCGCGNLGCLDAQAAGPGIRERYLRLAQGKTDALVDAKAIAVLARSGDPAAIKVYEDEGVYLAKALAAVVNAFNPSKVIIGGGISGAMDLFLPSLKAAMKERVYGEASRHVKIERTGLGYDAALIGAAALAISRNGV